MIMDCELFEGKEDLTLEEVEIKILTLEEVRIWVPPWKRWRWKRNKVKGSQCLFVLLKGLQ